jgi:C4-dicarboxylate-specific signal transduction histidine kinase
LTRAAEEIKSGNLHVSVNIKTNDEIGEFAKNFNDMVHKLSRSHEELEELVAMRTEALEKLNQELDAKIKTAIEENSQKEQMLIQQSRLAAMGEMIGNIAHQWRQPLNALGLVVQNIYYTYDAGELDKEYLERAMNKSKKLTTLMSKTIDDFRNFFRPDKLQERFKISERINSVAELVMASYKNHNITVTMELDDELESLGYPNEFSQVLLNVLTNAKDALIERKIELPKVIVRSFAQEERVVVEIEDNAGGIDEDIISKIFDPYFTTKDKSVGTGIGLYMSKMIIENNMHGHISSYNSEDGAVFRIEIKKFKEESINVI